MSEKPPPLPPPLPGSNSVGGVRSVPIPPPVEKPEPIRRNNPTLVMPLDDDGPPPVAMRSPPPPPPPPMEEEAATQVISLQKPPPAPKAAPPPLPAPAPAPKAAAPAPVSGGIVKPDASPELLAVLNLFGFGGLGYFVIGQKRKAMISAVICVGLPIVSCFILSPLALAAWAFAYDAYLLGQKLASGASIEEDESALAFLDALFKRK